MITAYHNSTVRRDNEKSFSVWKMSTQADFGTLFSGKNTNNS